MQSADQWWLVTILMVGSSSLMYTYVVKVPFYNKTYAIVISTSFSSVHHYFSDHEDFQHRVLLDRPHVISKQGIFFQ